MRLQGVGRWQGADLLTDPSGEGLQRHLQEWQQQFIVGVAVPGWVTFCGLVALEL